MPMTLPRVTSAVVSGRYVTWTVVSVMPYMLTSRGDRSPCRSNHGASMRMSSASPPKITWRSASGRRLPVRASASMN
jgi:hypothetical protein